MRLHVDLPSKVGTPGELGDPHRERMLVMKGKPYLAVTALLLPVLLLSGCALPNLSLTDLAAALVPDAPASAPAAVTEVGPGSAPVRERTQAPA